MKRKIIVLVAALVLAVAVSAPAAFAADENKTKAKDYFKSMFDSMRNWSKDAQENGQITQEEAKQWEKHFDDMEKFHEKNGFSGHCGGFTGQGTAPGGQNQSEQSGPSSMMGGRRSIESVTFSDI